MSFTPYQVDFSVKNTSKTFGFSKKRISFKFGVANNEAIEQGLTGAHCRGSEHEIIFSWSLNSGKRQILADGKDVHYSESGLNGWTTDQVFQHHFQMRVPNFSAPLRCHLITQPANRDVPSIQPFDLRVNGISFFSFSKIFQLGGPQMVSRPIKGASRSTNGDPEEDPYVTPEERKAIAAAKLASIRDIREREVTSIQSAPPAMNRDEGNLINLLDDPPASAPPPQLQPPPNHFVSSMTMDAMFTGAPAPVSAPYGQQAYNNYSLGPPPPQSQPDPHQQNPYGQPPPPQQQQPDPYAQQQSQYGQPPPPQLQPDPYAQQQSQYGQPPAQFQSDPYAQQQNQYGQPPPPQQQPDPYAQQQSQYGQPPPPQQQSDPYAQQQISYSQPPTPQGFGQQQNQFAYQQPPTPQGQYGGQQYSGFGAPPPGTSMMSPSGQSIASYGSAPAFAQPPRQAPQPQYQQQYQGFPQY